MNILKSVGTAGAVKTSVLAVAPGDRRGSTKWTRRPDILDDTDASRAVIERIVAFMQSHLLR
jgi:hypothetical protein